MKERQNKNWIKDQNDEVNHIKNTLRSLSHMFQVVSSASDNLLGFELANSEGICFKVITANFAAFRLWFTFLQTVKNDILLLFQWDKSGSWNLIKGYKFNEICGSSMTDLKTITLCRTKKSCTDSQLPWRYWEEKEPTRRFNWCLRSACSGQAFLWEVPYRLWYLSTTLRCLSLRPKYHFLSDPLPLYLPVSAREHRDPALSWNISGYDRYTSWFLISDLFYVLSNKELGN